MKKKSNLNQEFARQVGDTCLCFELQRTARKIGRLYDDALRPMELSNGQFTLLMSLVQDVPVAIGELSPILGMDRTTLTAYLKPLERRGLVKVIANPEDSRSRLPVLTLEGQKLLAKAIPAWQEVQRAIGALVPANELELMRSVLRRLA